MEEARRELLEETGYGGGEWEKLGEFASNPTSSTARLHVYLARGVKRLARPKADPREAVETSEIAPPDVLDMVARGEFSTHASVAAVMLAALKLGWLKTGI